MTLPINLILVRHGESEGNAVHAAARAGNLSGFTDEFMAKHSSQWKLTKKGIEQAKQAGKWLRENIDFPLDRYYASTYLRASHTAGHLGLPGALWDRKIVLRERDRGEIDSVTPEDLKERFAHIMAERDKNEQLWIPGGGESIAGGVEGRVRDSLRTLERKASEQNVIIVCHGETMWALRCVLENMPPERFEELQRSKNPHDRIHNCQIIHYSRRNPVSGELKNHYRWKRSVCPTDLSLSSNEWEELIKKKYTNEEMLALPGSA